MNITDLIIAENSGHQGTAIIDGGHELSYPELFKKVATAAIQLTRAGIGQGTHVLICLRGGADYIIISLAVLHCGGVLIPVIETAGDAEILSSAKIARARFLISGRTLSGYIPTEFSTKPFIKTIFIYQIPGAKAAARDILSLSAAFIRFSSGTTGASKGVILSHNAIEARTSAADKGLRVTRQDRVIWVLNMSFHFVVTIVLFLRRGAAIVICEEDFPRSFIATIKGIVPTLMYASPFHYSLLAQTGTLPKDVFRQLRLAVSTAMSLPLEVAEQFHAVYGIYPSQAYGIIEVGLPCVNASQDRNKVLSVGQPLPDYQLKFTDTDARGIGRILVKGKGLFDAYLDPVSLAENVLIDGWFDTGDIGKLDEEGYLFITGRTKNVINFCGMKIFPEEVEAVLNSFPGVIESRVFGHAHPQYGQIVCAQLVAGSIDLDALRLDCYRKLAKYKVPKEYTFVDHLPRTASGKIRR
jgi:long-chain acyl-CoA synthetase